jgi:hypothetical protein
MLQKKHERRRHGAKPCISIVETHLANELTNPRMAVAKFLELLVDSLGSCVLLVLLAKQCNNCKGLF